MTQGDTLKDATLLQVEDSALQDAVAAINGRGRDDANRPDDMDRLYEDIEAELAAAELEDDEFLSANEFVEDLDESTIGEALDDAAWISVEAGSKKNDDAAEAGSETSDDRDEGVRDDRSMLEDRVMSDDRSMFDDRSMPDELTELQEQIESSRSDERADDFGALEREVARGFGLDLNDENDGGDVASERVSAQADDAQSTDGLRSATRMYRAARAVGKETRDEDDSDAVTRAASSDYTNFQDGSDVEGMDVEESDVEIGHNEPRRASSFSKTDPLTREVDVHDAQIDADEAQTYEAETDEVEIDEVGTDSERRASSTHLDLDADDKAADDDEVVKPRLHVTELASEISDPVLAAQDRYADSRSDEEEAIGADEADVAGNVAVNDENDGDVFAERDASNFGSLGAVEVTDDSEAVNAEAVDDSEPAENSAEPEVPHSNAPTENSAEPEVPQSAAPNGKPTAPETPEIDAIGDRVANAEDGFGKLSHFMGVVAEKIDQMERRLEEHTAMADNAAVAFVDTDEDFLAAVPDEPLADEPLADDVAPYIANMEREIGGSSSSSKASLDIFDRIARAAETEFDTTRTETVTERLSDTSNASGHRIGTKKWTPSRTIKRRMRELNDVQDVADVQDDAASQPEMTAARPTKPTVDAVKQAMRQPEDDIAIPNSASVAAPAGEDLSAPSPQRANRRKAAEVERTEPSVDSAMDTELEAQDTQPEAVDDDDGKLIVVPGARGRRRSRARKSNIDQEMEDIFNEGSEDASGSIQGLRSKLRRSASAAEEETPPKSKKAAKAAKVAKAAKTAETNKAAKIDGGDEADGSVLGKIGGMFARRGQSDASDVDSDDFEADAFEPAEKEVVKPAAKTRKKTAKPAKRKKTQVEDDNDDDLMMAFDSPADAAFDDADGFDDAEGYEEDDLYAADEQFEDEGSKSGLMPKILVAGGGLLAVGAGYLGITTFL